MPYLELKTHFETFSKLINQIPASRNKHMEILVHLYVKQIIALLNDIILISLKMIKQLCQEIAANNMISLQLQFIHDIQSKLSTMQNCMLPLMGKHTLDYDEWLQAHCDLATD